MREQDYAVNNSVQAEQQRIAQQKAYEEAQTYGVCSVAASSADQNHTYIPAQDALQLLRSIRFFFTQLRTDAVLQLLQRCRIFLQQAVRQVLFQHIVVLFQTIIA